MKGKRSNILTFFAGALMLASAPTFVVKAQEKSKETQKPATSTVDAWRQALPPETESEKPAEGTGSAAQPRPSREEIETGLTTMERKWMEAVKLRDASTLSQIVADDFTLVSPRLVVAAGERDKYFGHAMRDLSLTSYEFEALTVRLYGRVAVVSGKLKQSATVAGEDWTGSYLITDVWVNRDGSWRVVSRHASLITEKK